MLVQHNKSEISKIQLPQTKEISSNPFYRIYFYSPDSEEIFNDIEGTYLVSLLKKKANAVPSVLEPAHAKAIRTLQILTKNMIGGEVPLQNIIEYYHEATRENVILLILRCKKMYEARIQVKRIIKMLIMLDDMFTQHHILLSKSSDFTH